MDREATACKLDEARQQLADACTAAERAAADATAQRSAAEATALAATAAQLANLRSQLERCVGQQWHARAYLCIEDTELRMLHRQCSCPASVSWWERICCRHCSERSQAESRLRSQLEASTRNNERLHADVRALTAVKCELEAEVTCACSARSPDKALVNLAPKPVPLFIVQIHTVPTWHTGARLVCLHKATVCNQRCQHVALVM